MDAFCFYMCRRSKCSPYRQNMVHSSLISVWFIFSHSKQKIGASVLQGNGNDAESQKNDILDISSNPLQKSCCSH